MALSGKLGLVLLGVGAAHFAAPEAFEDLTRAAFPSDTDKWVLRDGACEAAIGALLMVPPARKLGWLGLFAYTGWLGVNVAKAQG